MSDRFALIDARGRAAGAAVRGTTSLRALPDLPTPKRHGWVRPALVAVVAIAVVVGLVAIVGRDAAPVDEHDPKNLRYLIDDLPDGWSIRSVKDFGVQTGEVPSLGRYAVLFAVPGDPSARAIALQWADPATPEGLRYPPMGFSNLVFTDDVEEFDAAGRRAACGTSLEVGYRCYVETDQGMVQALAKQLSLEQVRSALAGLEFIDGHPTIAAGALPPGLVTIRSGPEWLFAPVTNPDSSEVASVEYQSADGSTALLVMGWADDHDLAESALEQPWSGLQVGNYPGFNSFLGPDSSSRSILWNRDGRTFFLLVGGDHSDALTMANAVRPATDTEWAAVPTRGEAGTSDEGVTTTASGEDASPDTVPTPTLGAGTRVTDQTVEMVVSANTGDDADFDVRIDGDVRTGVSVTVIGDTYGARLPGAGFFSGSLDDAINLQPIDTLNPDPEVQGAGYAVFTGGNAAVTLRVTATDGVRYLVDLVPMPGHPQMRVALVRLPTSVSVVAADVVDRLGTVIAEVNAGI